MSHTQKLLIALAAIVVGASLFASRHRPHVPNVPIARTASAKANHPAAAPAPADARDAGVGTGTPSPSTPDMLDGRPFAEIRPELERRALAGDAAAARRLGMTLLNCNHYVEMSDDKLQDLIVEGAARGFKMQDKGRDLSPDEMLARMRLGSEQQRRTCKGVSGLEEPDGFKKGFRWIERAAALGDPDAEAVYAGIAFADIDDRDALIDAEKMRDRKTLAIEYFDRSLAAGDALALLQMSLNAAADGGIFPVDPEKSYAYLYAYSLTSRSSEVVPEILEHMLSEHAAPLDEAARQRARAEGQRLAACCGATSRESP